MKWWLEPGGPEPPPPWCSALLCGGPTFPSPLPLISLTFVEDELGVAALELFGERASPPTSVEPDSGDAVPDVESFFLEVFESFALDNCSCYIHGQRSQISCNYHLNTWRMRLSLEHTTLCRKPFIFATRLYSTSIDTPNCRTRCSRSTSNLVDLLQPPTMSVASSQATVWYVDRSKQLS